MNAKREDTPSRVSRRNYEERNKDKRSQASGNFQTMLPRADFEEVCSFVKENNLTKVQFLKEALELMKKKYNS